jgi:hypothetical protein
LFRRRLTEEEKQRQNAFRNRMSKLEKFSSSYASDVGQQLQQKREEENRAIHESLLQKEKQDFEKERMKKETRAMTDLQNQQWNLTLMERKKKEKEDERQAAIEMRMKLERDMAEDNLKKKMNQEKRKQQEIEMKKNLDQQIQVRQHNKLKEKQYYNDSDSLLNPISVFDKTICQLF